MEKFQGMWKKEWLNRYGACSPKNFSGTGQTHGGMKQRPPQRSFLPDVAKKYFEYTSIF
jgi:hypothetical protein